MDPQVLALMQQIEAMKAAKQNSALGTMDSRAQLERDAYGASAGSAEDDIAQARGLQGQQFKNTGSAVGNVLGGMGDMLNTLRGGMMEKNATGARAQALKDYLAKRGAQLDETERMRGDVMGRQISGLDELKNRLLTPQGPWAPPKY